MITKIKMIEIMVIVIIKSKDTQVTSNDFYKTSEAETRLIQSGGDR